MVVNFFILEEDFMKVAIIIFASLATIAGVYSSVEFAMSIAKSPIYFIYLAFGIAAVVISILDIVFTIQNRMDGGLKTTLGILSIFFSFLITGVLILCYQQTFSNFKVKGAKTAKQSVTAPAPTLESKIEELNALKEKGTISEEEYTKMKENLINETINTESK